MLTLMLTQLELVLLLLPEHVLLMMMLMLLLMMMMMMIVDLRSPWYLKQKPKKFDHCHALSSLQ